MSESVPDGVEVRYHLSSEASAGIAFANVLLSVGLALVGILITNPPKTGLLVTAMFSSCIAFASFFATLFYANVHGALRLYGEDQYMRALVYGNAVTEYLGVFLLLVTFPLVVFAYTSDTTLAWGCSAIVGMGFLFYTFSGFDLLSRWLTAIILHSMTALAFVAIAGGMIYVTLHGPDFYRLPGAAVLLAFLIVLTILDVSVTLDRRDAARRKSRK